MKEHLAAAAVLVALSCGFAGAEVAVYFCAGDSGWLFLCGIGSTSSSAIALWLLNRRPRARRWPPATSTAR